MTNTTTEKAPAKIVFQRPALVAEVPTHYCAGCSHGIVHRLIAEVLEELGIASKTIGVAPIGCAVLIYKYLQIDYCEALHGRAPAVATGIKRMRPDRLVFTYQGDGDVGAIGTAEAVHAALRGENISIIFINNTIYGMTGGQMAPTTLPGQVTTSTPQGRDALINGNPIHMAELLSSQEGPAYVVRTAVSDPASVIKTRKAILTAFKAQQMGLGFSFVEVLSACPTNWGLAPIEANKWLRDNMIPAYPLGEFRVHERLRETKKG